MPKNKMAFYLAISVSVLRYTICSAIFLTMFGVSIKLGWVWVKLHESMFSNISIVGICVIAGSFGLSYGIDNFHKVMACWRMVRERKMILSMSNLMEKGVLMDKEEFEKFMEEKFNSNKQEEETDGQETTDNTETENN